MHTNLHHRGKKVVSGLIEKCFGGELKAKDRPLRLTYMKLRQFIGESMLQDCKDYFERNSRLPSCFKDIRPFIESFSEDECIAFTEFVVQETRKPRENLDEVRYLTARRFLKSYTNFGRPNTTTGDRPI